MLITLATVKITLLFAVIVTVYYNVGYFYIKFMTEHKSDDSKLRRFLAGGWNTIKDKSTESMKENFFFVHIWILCFGYTMVMWVVWIIFTLVTGTLYLIFGGFAQEIIKIAHNEELKTNLTVLFRKTLFLMRKKDAKKTVFLIKRGENK